MQTTSKSKNTNSKPTNLPLESPKNSKPSTLFVKNKKKSTTLRDLGLEYDQDVTNDEEYYEKIFKTNSYKPSQEELIDIYEDISRIMDGHSTRDKKNIGAMVGMTVLSVIGFLALSFTIIGGIVGGVLGLGLGRYAGRKLKKKIKSRGLLTQEELYVTKLECLLKLGTCEVKFSSKNLNKYRLLLEKIVEECAPLLDLTLFTNQKKITKFSKKIRKLLMKVESQKGMLLSYKLFKLFYKQNDMINTEFRHEVANKMHNIFRPYLAFIEVRNKSGKVEKKVEKLVTYQKVRKLMANEEITKICEEFPDIRKSEEECQKFKLFLKEQIDLQKRMSEAARTDNHLIESALELQNFPKEDLEQIHSMEKQQSAEVSSADFEERRSFQKIYHFECETPNLKKMSSNVRPETHSDAESEEERMLTLDDIEYEYKSSSESDENEDIEDEKKLMDDSALYDDKSQIKKLKPSPLKIMDHLEEQSDESRRSTPIQTPKGRKSIARTGPKAYCMTTADVDTKSDPLRTRPKPDIVRVNSHTCLSITIDKEDLEDEIESVKSQSMRKSILPPAVDQTPLKVGRESLSGTKIFNSTKREINFQKIMNLAYDEVSKWEKVCSHNTITIQKIKPEDSPVVLIRAWAFIEGFTPMEVFEQIYNAEKRCRWDTVASSLKVVDTLDEKTDVIYFLVKAPFGVSNRDFVQLRDYEFGYPQSDQIIMSFVSTTHPGMPPIKGNIRAETHIAGYLIKPSVKNPKSTDLCILSQVDIKGSIPKIIVNTVAGRAPVEWVHKLQKACERARDGQ